MQQYIIICSCVSCLRVQYPLQLI